MTAIAVTTRMRIAVAAALAVAAGVVWSTHIALVAQEPPAALDVVLRRFPGGWLQLAALAWPWLCRSSAAIAAGRMASALDGRAILRRVIGCGAMLLGSIAAGVIGGILTASWHRLVVPGAHLTATALVLAANLTALYVFTAALVVATRRPVLWLAAIPAGLVANYGLAQGLGWGPSAVVHRWIAVGDLGLGTFMEAPAIAGGLRLEPEWQSLSPWAPTSFWMVLSLLALGIGIRMRMAR